MASDGIRILVKVVADEQEAILGHWSTLLQQGGGQVMSGRIRAAEVQAQARTILDRVRDALDATGMAREDDARARLDEDLGEISRARAPQGVTAADTANFIFSLREPLFAALNRVCAGDPENVASGSMAASRFLDRLGLQTMQVFQSSREEIISRQSQEIAELSTPVVQLWRGILALPLIGTLDSARTGVVMENLLQAIVDEEAEIAIIDITGVPTVDTLVAQHLLKTVAAARLMGADCLISGIRPQIAQTMVHLGVELNVVSKATLADAFAVALRRTNRAVVRLSGPSGTAGAAA
jgi:rsbT co-antagonist protein RsbR